MHIDDKLKWDKHVSHICKSLSRNFHMFYSIRTLLPGNLKKQLYYSLVQSRILYGIEVYGACNDTLLNKVQVMQNKLLKVLFNLPYRHNTNQIHSMLKLLKVKDIYNLQVLKFVYESLNKLSIVQFQNYYRYQNNVHNYNIRNQYRLYANQRVRTKYGESTLHYMGTRLWNSIDDDIKVSKSVNIFKKANRNKFINAYS